MREYDFQDQAERFLAWFPRLPTTSLDEAFKKWADSKDFLDEDRKAIWDLIQEDARR